MIRSRSDRLTATTTALVSQTITIPIVSSWIHIRVDHLQGSTLIASNNLSTCASLVSDSCPIKSTFKKVRMVCNLSLDHGPTSSSTTYLLDHFETHLEYSARSY